MSKRTVREAGWHKSAYNLISKIPGTDKIGIANIYRGSFVVCTPGEVFLLSEIESLPEDHPIVEVFKKRGLIVNFDEREKLIGVSDPCYVGNAFVTLTVAVTMACNFDCAYCFEFHRGSRMTPKTQEHVIMLADRMLEVSGRKGLQITWFGGEPLLAPDIIDNMSARFMEIAEKRGIAYSASISTNGYLLTQDIVDMLHRNKIEEAVISLDGLGKIHDDVRHLAGGGPTFDRITHNLRTLKIPFTVYIRQPVHAQNEPQLYELRDYVKKLAEESGNNIIHIPDIAIGYAAPEERSVKVNMISDEAAARVLALRDTARFSKARGHYCGANSLWSLVIHATGALHKCWGVIDHPAFAFGYTGEWDPADPFGTAAHPEKLQCFFDTNISNNGDKECRECIWLPLCVGGCSYFRILYRKECVAYKDYPGEFMLGLYNRMQKKKINGQKEG